MRWFYKVPLRLRSFFRKSDVEQELSDELRFHLERQIEANLAQGMTPGEARYAALRELGGVEQIKEECRDVRQVNYIESFLQDVRYGLRQLRRSPGFTAVVILTLALAIGANTAIFSLVDAVMLRTLPVRDPGRLVQLLHQYPGEPRMTGFSWQSYQDFESQNHVFSGLIGAALARFSVRGENLEPETVDGYYVVGHFFQVLGVEPAIGRLIGSEDDHMGDPTPVAVLSWSFWKSQFNLDPTILGQRIIVDSVPLVVVGVTPPGFFGLQVGLKADIYLPLAVKSMIDHPSQLTSGIALGVMGRLKPGVSLKQARADMALLGQRWVEQVSKHSKNPLMHEMRFEVAPAAGGFSFVRDYVGNPLLMLMAVAILLLVVACINVASLLLARGAAREHEMAVRLALGAGRFRVVRQVLTESLLLSAAGSLLGIFLAYFGAHALVRLMTSGRLLPGFPSHIESQLSLDLPVLVFTAGIALLTGLLFGLAPALRALRTAPISSLRRAGTAGKTRFQQLFGKSLVVAQLALSIVMLSTAGLFVGYLEHLEHLRLGFRKDHLLLVTLDPANSGYQRDQLSRLYQELLGRLEGIPGVRSATLSGMTPISGRAEVLFVTVEGHPEKPEDRRFIMVNAVAPKYFETYGTPLLAGRDFTFPDQSGPRVAIINQAMARYYVGKLSPIGMHFTFDGDPKPYEVVGEVGDAKYNEVREAAPRTIYLVAQASSEFSLHTSINPEGVVPDVRRTVLQLLKTVPITNVRTMADQVDASIVPERLIATLSGWFGALGALLAAIGLYGLLAYTVARRTSEIGIRLALGATPGGVSRMVLGDAFAMLCTGLAVGVPLALVGKRLTAHVIEGLPVNGAISIVVGAVGMIAVALLAAYVPAHRASRVDPIVALRHE
ncbi:MAG TPA: ABC transporter permease [Terriglobia bacterium]